jgi:hypothetical protein
MALLSGAMRAAAITGSAEPFNAWFAGRQWGRWVTQSAPAPAPASGAHRTAPSAPSAPRAGREDTLRSLRELRQLGVIDDTELAGLRARLRV